MSELKTVIMLSRFFPPAFAVGGKRAYRFAKHLPDHGWRAVIVTDDAPPPDRADASAEELPGVHRVIREWLPASWPRSDKRPDSDGTVAAPTRAYGGPPKRLTSRVKWHLRMPFGNDWFAAPHLTRLVRRLNREERADAIWATSGPYSALLYGALGKAVTGLPLLLDLRDPWSMNFLQRNKSPWTRFSETRMEGRLLRSADAVTLTCESATEAYRQAYPDIADRIGTIFNSFEPALRPERPSLEPDAPMTVVHFGNCYGMRRLETVLRAIARLRDEDAVDPRRLRLHNLGRMAEQDLALAHELAIEPFVSSQTVVPYTEGLAILARADLQLLVAYGTEELFIPAKLFDYLLTGAPILCLAPPSELTRLVARTQSGRSVSPGGVNDAAEVLRAALSARQRGERIAVPDRDAVAAFSAEHTAHQLARRLDAMVRRERV